MMKQVTPTAFTAGDGTACVSVRLAHRPDRWITTVAAYAELVRAGMSGHFWLGHGARGIGYVEGKLSGHGDQVIARLIARAGVGQQVAYRDGDRLNLRPDNLVLEPCRHARAPSSLILMTAQARALALALEREETPEVGASLEAA